MELVAYLRILWRRRIVVGIVILFAALVTGIAIALIPKTYTASVTLRVAPAPNASIEYAQLLYSERIINTYAKLVTSRMAISELSSKVDFGSTPPQIDAEVIAETELLKIIVQHRDPEIARNTAAELANILIQQRMARGVRVDIMEPVSDPIPTSVVSYALYAFVGIIAGLGAGGGLAFVLENLDKNLHTPEQIAAVTGLPVLGQVPDITGEKVDLTGNLHFNEAYRLIRVNLLSMIEEQHARTLLITSAEPQEGKSVTTAHLALSLAQTNRKVIAVDADLYCSRIHEIFGLPNEQGLSSVLLGEIPLEDAIQKGPHPNLHVLTSGPGFSSHSDHFYPTQVGDVLTQLANRYDLVLLDTPPVRALADAVELASIVDGVVLVASCNKVDRDDLVITCHQLGSVDTPLLGVIVNRAKPTNTRRYTAYY